MAMNDPTTEPYVARFFAYAHLPAHLQEVSKPFCNLATQIVETIPHGRERAKALDHLLYAKDAAVRAMVK